MAHVRFDQVNVIVADVAAAAAFLRRLGVEMDDATDAWSHHHCAVPTVDDGFDADLDSPAFAQYWGGLRKGFTGVVVNLRVGDRHDVDVVFERALAMGASGLKQPWDAFWGSRYALIEAPGPLFIGLMSESDPTRRTPAPEVQDFA